MHQEVKKAGDGKCIVCGWPMRSSMGDSDVYMGPGGGIVFRDCGNFGSRLSDSCYDGEYLEVIVCDECVEERRQRVQEYVTPGYEDARNRQSAAAMSAMPEDWLEKSMADTQASIARTEKIKAALMAGEPIDPDDEAWAAEKYDGYPTWQEGILEPPWDQAAANAEAAIYEAKRLEERKQLRLAEAKKFIEENEPRIEHNVT